MAMYTPLIGRWGLLSIKITVLNFIPAWQINPISPLYQWQTQWRFIPILNFLTFTYE